MKRILKVLLYLVGAVVVIVIGLLGYLRFALPNVGAPMDIRVATDSASVARGKYLAHHVAVCMDCHSDRDWTKYSAPVIMESLGKGGEKFGTDMGLPGDFFAKNITPYGIGKMTDGEVFRAVTSGVLADGEPMFPIMPYDRYHEMDKTDVENIIAYIRTLKPITNDVPKRSVAFPMNFIERTIPKKYENPIRPPESNAVEYGKYLASMASCTFCHTPQAHGSPVMSRWLAGGHEFPFPEGTHHSANITMDKETGIGLWSEEQFVAKFKQYANVDSLATVKNISQNTVMPWNMYAGMKESDLKAIFAYLQSQPPVRNKVERFVKK